jgi:hypothetical protein
MHSRVSANAGQYQIPHHAGLLLPRRSSNRQASGVATLRARDSQAVMTRLSPLWVLLRTHRLWERQL